MTDVHSLSRAPAGWVAVVTVAGGATTGASVGGAPSAVGAVLPPQAVADRDHVGVYSFARLSEVVGGSVCWALVWIATPGRVAVPLRTRDRAFG